MAWQYTAVGTALATGRYAITAPNLYVWVNDPIPAHIGRNVEAEPVYYGLGFLTFLYDESPGRRQRIERQNGFYQAEHVNAHKVLVELPPNVRVHIWSMRSV